MKKAPVPVDDEKRVEALMKYQIQVGCPSKKLQKLVKAAANLCGAAHAMINLVDKDCLHFHAKFNVEGETCPRDISFCGHTVVNSGPLVVPDATKDERFSDNPMVVEGIKLRFYAGFPLVSPDGYQIGSLCIFDPNPGNLETRELEILQYMAENIIESFEMSFNNKRLQELHLFSEELQVVSRIGGWKLDIQSGVTTWTSEIYRIYAIPEGTPTSQLQGLNNYTEPYRSLLENEIESCIKSGISFEGIYGFVDCLGNKKWIKNMGHRVEGALGHQLVGTCQDVTEYYEKEIEIEIQRNFLHHTIENLPSPFYAISTKEEYLIVNDSFNNYFNSKNINPVGKSDRDILAQKNLEMFRQKDQFVLRTNQVIESEDKIIDVKGQTKIFNSIRFPYLDSTGSIFAVGCISLDITNKKMLESQSLHRAKLASIGEMAAGAGHEINNPLAVILGNLSKLKVLQKKGEVEKDTLLNCVEIMENSASRIAKIVTGIKSFSRFDPEGKVSFDPIEAFRESVLMLQEIHGKEGLNISLHSEIANPPHIFGSRGQFQQIVINLMSNAIDAVSDSIDPRISARISADGRQIKIEICDNGTGMSRDVQRRIFDPFFSTKGEKKGTGIGLSIVQKLVADNFGRIDVESQEGRGTQFTIEFPLVTEKNRSEDRPIDSMPDIKTWGGNQRILIIDDELEVRNIVKENLEMVGFQVKALGSGEEAIKLFSENKNFYDLILCDIKMPGINGYKVFLNYQKSDLNGRSKFFFMTGGVDLQTSGDISKINKQVDGFLYKPFEIMSVFDLIKDNCKNDVGQSKQTKKKKNAA